MCLLYMHITYKIDFSKATLVVTQHMYNKMFYYPYCYFLVCISVLEYSPFKGMFNVLKKNLYYLLHIKYSFYYL